MTLKYDEIIDILFSYDSKKTIKLINFFENKNNFKKIIELKFENFVWKKISSFPYLSNTFIYYFQDYLDLKDISLTQNLNDKIIHKFIIDKKINYNNLLKNPFIQKDFPHIKSIEELKKAIENSLNFISNKNFVYSEKYLRKKYYKKNLLSNFINATLIYFNLIPLRKDKIEKNIFFNRLKFTLFFIFLISIPFIYLYFQEIINNIDILFGFKQN